MKKFLVLTFLLIISISLSAQENLPGGFQIPSHQQVGIEQELGYAMVQKLDSISTTPNFDAQEFEKLTCILLDDLLSQNYLLSAGMILHKAFNILIDPANDKTFKSNLVGLTTAAAELYLRGGAFDVAADFLENADSLCHLYRNEGKEYYLRNVFNIASLLFYNGQSEAAAKLYMKALEMLEEEGINNASPATINAMLYCAFLLTDYAERNFFSDTVSLIAKLDKPTEVNFIMYNLLKAQLLSKFFNNYEKASEVFDQMQNIIPHLCHSIALPEIIENEWKLDPEKYRSSLPYYRYAFEDVIIANLNSFTYNSTERYWDRVADKIQRAFRLGLDSMPDDNFYLTAVHLNSSISKNLSIFTQRELDEKIKDSRSADAKQLLYKVKNLKKRIGNSTDSLLRKHMQRELEDAEWPLRVSFNIASGFVKNNNAAVSGYHHLDKDECEVEIIEYPHLDKNGLEIPHFGAIILSKEPHHDRYLDIDSYVDKREFIDLGPTLAWDMVYNGLGKRKDNRLRARQYSAEEMIGVGNLVRPLAKRIERFKRAYVSSSGVLNTINLGAVPYGDNGQPLNETVEIVNVNASYDLQRIKETSPTLPTAAIFSNINYNRSETGKDDRRNNSETKGYMIKMEKGGNMKKFYTLPIDEKSLTAAIKLNSKKIKSYSGEYASEEAFKSLDGKAPTLIHLDSHGFYIPEESNAFIGKHVVDGTRERALLTCGLPLAGANIAWSGKELEKDKEDGILTAWEVACMDLSGCKLAVLSACETAQGDIDPINGVIGLQRALRIAGVQSMLLTLWPVDNELTQEFINSFYTALPDSKDFNEAFVKTQRMFRQRHPDPYLWAPFILIN